MAPPATPQLRQKGRQYWFRTVVYVLTYRTDVLELLGAHIVGANDERLVIGVQVLAQTPVVLHVTRSSSAWQPYQHKDAEEADGAKHTSSFFSSLLAEGILDVQLAGPNRVNDRQAEFNLQ